MKYLILAGFFLVNIVNIGCRTTRKINKAIAPKDTTSIMINKSAADSAAFVNEAMQQFRNRRIEFKTFSAKIKVEIEDSKGKQPDITAVVRIIKDSTIWISLSATFLNIEVYRVRITKDSVILLNKQNKEVQFRSLDFLQDVTEIPFDFKTVQDLLVGNPVFYNDSFPWKA